MVGDDIRCFMNIAVWKDNLQCIGWGISVLAQNVNNCMKEYDIKNENNYLIEDLDVYGNCVFIMIETKDNFIIYPIREFLLLGNWNPSHCQSLDKVYYSFKDLFNEFKDEESCFSVYCPDCLD
jgi:hypothetical protein